MKNTFIILLASFFALNSCTTFKANQREPNSVVKMFSPKYSVKKNQLFYEPGSPNYVNPSLIDDPVSPAEIERIRKELFELSKIEFSKIKPALMAVPDFDVAVKVFRLKVKKSMMNYFYTLDDIKKDIRYTFSELMALKQAADEDGANGSLLDKQYELDVKLKIPELHKKINIAYESAYRKLMTLDFSVKLAVKHKRDTGKSFVGIDIFKNQQIFSYDEGLTRICETKICLSKLASELENWQNFVRSLNQEIKISDYNEKEIWTSKPIDTSPHVTLALIDAADELINSGLKTNKDYSIVGALAKHAANTITTPVGLSLALLSAPVYLLEKISTAAEAFFKLRVMRLELAINEIPLYDKKASIKGLRYGLARYAQKLSTSAIYIHEGENKNEIIGKAFKEALYRGKSVLNTGEPIFSLPEMSIFVNKEWIDFDQVRKIYSQEQADNIFMNSAKKDTYLQRKEQHNLQSEKQNQITEKSGEEIFYIESKTTSSKVLIENGIAYLFDWAYGGENTFYIIEKVGISNAGVKLNSAALKAQFFVPSLLDPNTFNYFKVPDGTTNFDGLTPNEVFVRKDFASTSPNFSFKNIINSDFTIFKFLNQNGTSDDPFIAIKNTTARFRNWEEAKASYNTTVDITDTEITIPWSEQYKFVIVRNPRELNQYYLYHIKHEEELGSTNKLPKGVLQITNNN